MRRIVQRGLPLALAALAVGCASGKQQKIDPTPAGKESILSL